MIDFAGHGNSLAMDTSSRSFTSCKPLAVASVTKYICVLALVSPLGDTDASAGQV
jgi:hypothetical protein